MNKYIGIAMVVIIFNNFSNAMEEKEQDDLRRQQQLPQSFSDCVTLDKIALQCLESEKLNLEDLLVLFNEKKQALSYLVKFRSCLFRQIINEAYRVIHASNQEQQCALFEFSQCLKVLCTESLFLEMLSQIIWLSRYYNKRQLKKILPHLPADKLLAVSKPYEQHPLWVIMTQNNKTGVLIDQTNSSNDSSRSLFPSGLINTDILEDDSSEKEIALKPIKIKCTCKIIKRFFGSPLIETCVQQVPKEAPQSDKGSTKNEDDALCYEHEFECCAMAQGSFIQLGAHWIPYEPPSMKEISIPQFFLLCNVISDIYRQGESIVCPHKTLEYLYKAFNNLDKDYKTFLSQKIITTCLRCKFFMI